MGKGDKVFRTVLVVTGVVAIGWLISHTFRNWDSIPRRKRVNAELMALTNRVKNNANDKEALSTLIKDLRDSYHWRRTGAASCLGQLGSKAKIAVPALATALKHPDPYLRREAALALERMGKDAENALPALIEALKLGDCDASWFSAEAIGNLGAEAKSAIPSLIVALDASTLSHQYGPRYGHGPTLSFEAADALGKLGFNAKEALPSLKAHLSTPCGEFRVHLAHAVRQIDPTDSQALEVLIDSLKQEEVSAQIYGLQALGNLGTNAEPAIPAIENYIEHGEFKDRAKDALNKVKGIAG
jgi:HEAT repeat protein